MIVLQQWRRRLKQDPRFARILHGSLSGIAGRGFGLLVSLVTLPLTVRYLGKLEYGVWVTISTSVVMMSVLDLGIANTLTNFISEAYAEDDRNKAQEGFATAFWLTVALTLTLAPACFFAWRLANWGSIFHLQDPVLLAQAKECVAISAAFFLFSLPLNLANRVLGGYQQVHLSNYFAMSGSILGLIAILSVVALKGTLVHLTAAYCAVSLLGNLGLNLWLCLWQKPWIMPLPWKMRREIARALFGQGSLFFILQLTGLIVFNSDNLVITHYLGAAEVTPYSVAWRLTGYASLLQSLIVPSLWPAFTEAYRKRDLVWVRSTYHSINRKSLTAVGIAAVVLALAGRTVIRLWAGNLAVPSSGLLWLMAIFAFVISVTTNQSVVLTATGRLRLEAGVAVLAAIANLYLSIHLVQRIGAEGVILSSILSFLVVMYIPQAWEVRRVLSGRYMPDDPASIT
jgi:O-antigen/teichoic acid export membrane protein